jgi:hypothetical protein
MQSSSYFSLHIWLSMPALSRNHGHNFPDVGGEFHRLTYTHPQAVTCHGP